MGYFGVRYASRVVIYNSRTFTRFTTGKLRHVGCTAAWTAVLGGCSRAGLLLSREIEQLSMHGTGPPPPTAHPNMRGWRSKIFRNFCEVRQQLPRNCARTAKAVAVFGLVGAPNCARPGSRQCFILLVFKPSGGSGTLGAPSRDTHKPASLHPNLQDRARAGPIGAVYIELS